MLVLLKHRKPGNIEGKNSLGRPRSRREKNMKTEEYYLLGYNFL
jgi:hypothetical protein